MTSKILIGIPPTNHVILALDEFNGLKKLGYSCSQVTYSRNRWSISKINRLYGVLYNAFNIVNLLYREKPHILYLNSRVNSLGVVRDFISVSIFRLFYRRNLKIVIKSHGSDLSMLKGDSFFYKKFIVPQLIKKVDGWLMLSQDEKTNLIKLLPELDGKVFVTYNIIDPTRSIPSERFKEKYNLRNDKFKFLFVGRMIRDKGVFTILEAIANFEKRDECLFLMVGSGPELENLLLRAKQLGIEQNLKFTGFIQEEECDHFYANMDTLLFPSLDEGFAMALFKSVSCGMPIITTQIRAAKDELKSPDNCLWVDGESKDSVLAAITELYNNSSLRNQMMENNLLLGKKYTRDRVCEDMHEIFQGLLNNSSKNDDRFETGSKH